MATKLDYINELEKRHGSSSEIDELKSRYEPAKVMTPKEASNKVGEAWAMAQELRLPLTTVKDNFNEVMEFRAAKEPSVIKRMFDKYIKDPITAKTGFFQPYTGEYTVNKAGKVVPKKFRNEQIFKTTTRAGLHYFAKYATGRGLYLPDLMVKAAGQKLVDEDTIPPDTLADLVDTYTGFEPSEQDIKAGKAVEFIGGIKTTGKLVGKAVAKIPARAALKIILGSGLTFLSRKAADEFADKIIKDDPIDWKGIGFESGLGALWGIGEVAAAAVLTKLFIGMKKSIAVSPQTHKELERIKVRKDIKIAREFHKKHGRFPPEMMNKYVHGPQGIDATRRNIPSSEVKVPADFGKNPIVLAKDGIVPSTVPVKPPVSKPVTPPAKPSAAAPVAKVKPEGIKAAPLEAAEAKVAIVRIKDGKPQVKFPEDKDFGPLTEQFSNKPIEKIISELEKLPANKGIDFRTEQPRLAETVEPTKEIVKKSTPPVGGKEAGFVDLTPLIEAGKQLQTLEDKVTKLTTRFAGIDKPVQQAFIEYEEQLKELPQVAADISKKAGFLKLTEEQERLLEDFTEQAEKFPEKFPKGLPPELQESFEVLQAGIANAKERLQKLDVSANWPEGQIEFLENRLKELNEMEEPNIEAINIVEQSIEDLKGLRYIHHAYKDSPNKAIKRWFGRKKITKKPIGLLGRKFPTLEVAEKEGFVRAPLAVSYADMWHKIMRAEQADKLIKTINENPNLSLWSEVAPDDWVTIPEHIFPSSKQHTTSVVDGKVKRHTRTRKYPPAIAEALLELTYTRGTHAIERAYDKFNLAMKLIGFYNPLVMGKNDAVQLWRAAGIKGFGHPVKAMKTFLTKDETYQKLRKGGLFNNVVNYGPSVEIITQNMLDKIRLSSGERAAKRAKEWLNPKNFLTDLKKVQNNTTWKMDEVIRIALWHAVDDSKMLEGLSEFEKIEWVNDAMVNYGKFPKETKRWANKAVYVPTYRIGNFRFWWGQLAKHPWKFKGPILRTLGWKAFVQWGLPAIVASIIAFKTKRRFDEVRGDVFTERGYRLVIHNPETNTDTVYALSDPILEGQKLTQREFRRTLELNMAAAPAFILRVLQGRKRTATEDPLGEFFKLGTPFYRDIVTAKAKDKNRVQKILTHLAIAFTYKRQGREQDKVNIYEQTARTLSLWTDWQAQKADLKAIWTGKPYFYGPNGKFGRLVREFEADKKIKVSKIDKEIDVALANGNDEEAVKIAIDARRYQTTDGLSGRFLRWKQPLIYLHKTMPKRDKADFIKWLQENKKMSSDEIDKLMEIKD